MKNYKLYIHINKINNKKYVGITSLIPNKRWSNGNGYKDNYYFYNAIKKYGWKNFEHIILFDNLTLEEASKLECEYIEKYKTLNKKYGYNLKDGGANGCHTEETKEKIRIASINIPKESRLSMAKKLSKPVYQYDLDGNFIKKFNSTRIAGEELNISSAHICAVCNGKRKTANGFIFKYYKKNKIAKQNKKVVQLDLNNVLIKEFSSATVAAKELNILRTTICAICNHHTQRKTAGGYVWKFSEEYYGDR